MLQQINGAPPLTERAVDMMLFLLAQARTPTSRDWYAAVEDQFCELSDADQRRIVDRGMATLEQLRQNFKNI